MKPINNNLIAKEWYDILIVNRQHIHWCYWMIILLLLFPQFGRAVGFLITFKKQCLIFWRYIYQL